MGGEILVMGDDFEMGAEGDTPLWTIYILILKQEINLQMQKVSKLQSKILVEKSVIKHL